MLRRRSAALVTTCIVLLALAFSATAGAQDDEPTPEDETAEAGSYGDVELIEALRRYGLLDEWLAASPVSPEASLLAVTGERYQTLRADFLASLESWAARTERVRSRIADIDAAQENADALRSATNQVRDALVFDDRLAQESETLAVIAGAIAQLESVQILEHTPGESEDPLVLGELQLSALLEQAKAELESLNGVAPAFESAGVDAFAGYGELQAGLNEVDLRIVRARELIQSAAEASERSVSAALAQIPNLHAARMLQTTEVNGLSVVTIDAYIRAAEATTCSVDWAMLAGIGQIESNHGQIEGAAVSRSGRVSVEILGPLLDGGESQIAPEVLARLDANQRATLIQAVDSAQEALLRPFTSPAFGPLRSEEDASVDNAARGNGFAIVVDTDDGLLDGNESWDRAVGPMQFLPETWNRWATDGNGDGVADPHNLYDASAAASRFLCALSESRPSPSRFILGYNASTSYVRNVLAAAEQFRSLALPQQ